jgi:hypothetical protein
MTHDKKLLDVMNSFSPMSLQDAEKSTELAITLEKVVMQEGKENLSACLEGNHEGIQSDEAVSSALKNTTPYLWIFGLMGSTPCM